MNITTLGGTPMERAMLAAVEAGVPCFLWGKPGVGKTASIEHRFAGQRHVETVIASIRDTTDFLGLPIESRDSDGDANVDYAPPGWARRLAKSSKGLAFIDEATTCAASTWKAMLRVVQERYVGELYLGDATTIICAANPVDIAVGGNELDPPTANRFMHLDWVFNAGFWLDNIMSDFENPQYPHQASMITKGDSADMLRAGQMVLGYLNANPAELDPAVPAEIGTPDKSGHYAASYGYPSPRSWRNLRRVLAFLHPQDESAMLLAMKGLVGLAAARNMLTWLKANDLYDPSEVLAGRVAVDWTDKRRDRIFALMQAITTLTQQRGGAEDHRAALAVFVECLGQGRKDVVVPGLRRLLNTLPRGVAVPHRLREALADVVLPY